MGTRLLGHLFGLATLFPILVTDLVLTLSIISHMTLPLRMGSEMLLRTGSRIFLRALLRMSCEPKVWVPLFAAVRVVLDLRVRQVVIRSLDFIGEATLWLSLLVTVLIISGEKILSNAPLIVDVLFKKCVHPTAVLATVLAFRVAGLLAWRGDFAGSTSFRSDDHHVCRRIWRPRLRVFHSDPGPTRDVSRDNSLGNRTDEISVISGWNQVYGPFD